MRYSRCAGTCLSIVNTWLGTRPDDLALAGTGVDGLAVGGMGMDETAGSGMDMDMDLETWAPTLVNASHNASESHIPKWAAKWIHPLSAEQRSMLRMAILCIPLAAGAAATFASTQNFSHKWGASVSGPPASPHIPMVAGEVSPPRHYCA